MKGLRYSTLVLMISLFHTGLFSQPSSSFYSMFGIGDLDDYGVGLARAMGGTGIAINSKESLNNLNPASYAGIDSFSFHFEFGFDSKFSSFANYKESHNILDATFRYFALGTRFNKWWSWSIGIAPYSTVGYSINTYGYISGSYDPFEIVISGEGGLNQLYFGNSFKLFKGLSAGINTTYLFGSITHNESSNTYKYSLDEISRFRKVVFDYGLQYALKHNDINYSIGLTYSNPQKLNPENELNMFYSDDTFNVVYGRNGSFSLPQKTGIGLSLNKDSKFIAAADYSINQWSGSDFNTNSKVRIVNREKFSMGLEYNPRTILKKTGIYNLSYRLGGYIDKSYLMINNENIFHKAVILGVGIPLRKDLSKINISLEAGQEGTLKNSLIRENYFLIHLNLNLRDFWFIKAKID